MINYILVMKSIYLIPFILFGCNSVDTGKKEEYPIKQITPINIDTTDRTEIAVKKKFPIRVTEVILNDNKEIDMKYMVYVENGILYYTNKPTKVGDTAFYDTDIYKIFPEE